MIDSYYSIWIANLGYHDLTSKLDTILKHAFFEKLDEKRLKNLIRVYGVY